ncbi:MAG: FAD-dependent oxidoreductase [Betaproteobacteria bacterium]
MTADARTLPEGDDYDVIVIGAGAGGMTAALVARLEGKRTLLIERSDRIGGTTARSSGTVWIPDNPEQRRHGVRDDAAAARTYLDALVGAHADPALREAFIVAGPRMLAYLEERTDVRFRSYLTSVDYRQDLPGAARGGRPLEPLPFDGRTLGDKFDRVRAPLPELMLFGGMMITRGEAARLLLLPKSADAFSLGARLVTRYAADRLRFRRGTRLVLGNALAARLYRNLVERDVPIWYDTVASRLVVEGGRVTGVVVQRDGRSVTLRSRCGVVLAGGGFPANAQWRERYLPQPVPRHTPAFEGCTGTTLELALGAGAALGRGGIDNAQWFPSSIATRKDGSTIVYPHIVLDRAKPGLVAVNAHGQRFVDEAVSYHEFVRAMYAAHVSVPTIPAWLVCDRRFVWKYGLGMIRPRILSLARFVDRGYLKTAPTIAALAQAIGVDAAGLARTVELHNAFARAGHDPDFGKGANPYDVGNGDPDHRPNPCLGPIATPPFCAVAVEPTPLGTSLGLRTDASARVCNHAGDPIPGLFACGNDMDSPFGGEYPGAGAQIGLAMTFGYIAVQTASRLP